MARLPRTQLTIATTLALLGAVWLLSPTGEAQSAAGLTLHFVATQRGHFESRGRFGPGSVAGYKESVKTDGGKIGRDIGLCTITDLRHKESFCQIDVVLPDGQLLLVGRHREDAASTTLAVTGGTGTYNGASGSALTKEAGRKTDVTVTLTR
jgi:hypothetical protein